MKKYMSNKELDEFIKEIETEEINAPFYLKKEILDNVFHDIDEKIVAFDDSKTHIKRKTDIKKRKKQYYIYIFKVYAGIAAAIVLLFLLPNENNKDKRFYNKQNYGVLIEKNMEKVSNGITKFFDGYSKISSKVFNDSEEFNDKEHIKTHEIKKKDYHKMNGGELF